MFEIIAALLRKHNLSMTAAAEKIGIPQSSFSDWKARRKKPSVENLVKLSDFFGVSVDYLLGRTTRRKPYRS